MRHNRGRFQSSVIAALPVVASASLASTAHAQWTVTNLHPIGAAGSSAANAAGGGQQAGWSDTGGVAGACLWSGGATTWVRLHPAGAAESIAYGTDGGKQVGRADLGGVRRASLWSGTATSWVDLHPPGANQSEALAISGGKQVGYTDVGDGSPSHASMWSGTAASWIDLNPAGAGFSNANAASGGQQAGFAFVAGVGRASLWSGTAASWVDLHPAVAGLSIVYAASPGQQAGYARFANLEHASLWSGSAASWVDLHPPGATTSVAFAVGHGKQAGYAEFAGVTRAGVWSGSAATWVDLSALLPAEFTYSLARGMSSDATYLYVAGYGLNTLTNRIEALLWKRPLCDVAPGIAIQPQAATVCPSSETNFTIGASGIGAISYQWQIKDSGLWQSIGEGADIVLGGAPSGQSQGSTTASFTWFNAPVSPNPGRIRCIVTNACGSVTSEEVTLTVQSCAGCSLADIAGGGTDGRSPDGVVDGSDFIAFINSFSTGDPAIDPLADVAGGGSDGLRPDGIIDGSDFIAFINAFAAGC